MHAETLQSQLKLSASNRHSHITDRNNIRQAFEAVLILRLQLA